MAVKFAIVELRDRDCPIIALLLIELALLTRCDNKSVGCIWSNMRNRCNSPLTVYTLLPESAMFAKSFSTTIFTFALDSLMLTKIAC